MNWEESKANTPLKRDFLLTWFAEEQRFFLTGGSALGLFYLEHRRSYHLDLFTGEDIDGKEVQNLVQRVASKINADCSGLRSAPDFHRFELKRDGETEIIDVVIDRARQLDDEKMVIDGIRVDTLREILANKLTTLISRTELKDIVDLYFLELAGQDLVAALPDARLKDGGWEPAIVAMLLDGWIGKIGELPAWMIRELEPADLEEFLQRLRMVLVEQALPEK